jgi:putative inorganic carbon (hco3(-)) transporter
MSFFFFILYLICVFIRPQDWVPAVYAWPLIYITSIATIVVLLLESAGKPAGQRLVKAPQSGLMLGFFLTILMSHIVHTYFAGLSESFNKFLPTFILFFVILNAIDTERKLKFTVWFIILVMFILVFQGIYQLKTGYGWAGQPITTQFGETQPMIFRINWVGIFNDPNDLALTFVIAVGFILPLIFSRINFVLRLINTAILGCLGYGIYLTNSRGGQLALLATVFFFFARKTKKFLLGGIMGGLGALVILALGPSRMGALSTSEESAANRMDLWYEGILLFKSNPIFGVGHGMFMEELPQTAHNSYVLAFSELGFVGLFLWVALIYISMKGLLLVQSRDERLKDYALGIQSALVGFCSAAFFLSRTYVILPYMLFAMAGSTVWLSSRHPEGQRPEGSPAFKFTGKDARNVFLLSVGVFLAVMFTIKFGTK